MSFSACPGQIAYVKSLNVENQESSSFLGSLDGGYMEALEGGRRRSTEHDPGYKHGRNLLDTCYQRLHANIRGIELLRTQQQQSLHYGTVAGLLFLQDGAGPQATPAHDIAPASILNNIRYTMAAISDGCSMHIINTAGKRGWLSYMPSWHDGTKRLLLQQYA